MGKTKTRVCPKCGEAMSIGRLYPGRFKEPITFGESPKKRGVLTYTPKEKKEIVAYACEGCG